VDSPLTAFDLSQLRRRSSLKWRRYPEDVLPMWVAEMDTPLAEPIAAALRTAIELGDTGYPDPTDLIQAFRGFVERRFGWAVPAERIAPVADVMRGAVEALKLVLRPGSTVVVNPPVYPPFFGFLADAGFRVGLAPLTTAGRLDPEELDNALRVARAEAGPDGTVGYLLSSPHNPTGVVHSPAELAQVAERAAQYRARVVVDEIHAPVTLAGAVHTPYLSLPGTADAFALWSASKGWNLAGLKAAVLVAGDGLATDDLGRLSPFVEHGLTHFGALAHAAAFRDGDEWLAALLAGLSANRDRLGELLATGLPGIAWNPPAATFLAWLDCRGLGWIEDPAEVFLRAGKVALMSGPGFGLGGSGFARLNFGTSPAVLADGVARLVGAVQADAGGSAGRA
jgi:cystathionine beta-lyase